MSETPEKKEAVLSGKQRKYLKGLGHHLEPLISIGKEGLTENIIKATRQELLSRELIKVKIATTSSMNKKEVAALLPTATDSALVHLLGKTLLLYKENPRREKEQRIVLPR